MKGKSVGTFLVFAVTLAILIFDGTVTVMGVLTKSVSVPSSGSVIRKKMVVGVDYWCGFTASDFTERDLPFLKEGGIQMLRIEFRLEHEANLKALVPLVTGNGIAVLGLLMREDLIGNIDAWGNWVYNTVLAYRDKVKVWEIWNEANWGTGFQDNPEGYTEFLKRAYTRAKQADPGCTILGGSLIGTTEQGLNYLRTMYDNGAKDYMDAVSVHPYCNPASPLYPHVNEWGGSFWGTQFYRDLMVERGDGSKKIWVTEVGWMTGPAGDEGANTEEEQALYLKQALELARSWGWVEAFIVFNWMDAESANLYYGIVRERYSPPYTYENFCKPSFFALKSFVLKNT